MIFELVKGGTHSEGGKTYKVGDRIETDHDLCAKFGKKKFRLIEDEAGNTVTPSQPEIPKSTDAPLPPVAKMASGMAMTMIFPTAKDTGLDIMKIGEDQFQVTKNGFLCEDGVFTRAEILIYLKNFNASMDSK